MVYLVTLPVAQSIHYSMENYCLVILGPLLCFDVVLMILAQMIHSKWC